MLSSKEKRERKGDELQKWRLSDDVDCDVDCGVVGNGSSSDGVEDECGLRWRRRGIMRRREKMRINFWE